MASIRPPVASQPTTQIRSGPSRNQGNSRNGNQNSGRNSNNSRNGNGQSGGLFGGLGNQNSGSRGNAGSGNNNGRGQQSGAPRNSGNNGGNRNGAGNGNGNRNGGGQTGNNGGGNNGRGNNGGGNNGGRGNNGNNNRGGNGNGGNGNGGNGNGGNGNGGNGNGCGGNSGETRLTGFLERTLDSDFDPVRTRIPALRPNLYASTTNIAGGLRVAIEELIPKKRRLPNGTEVEQIIVLMTDGHANVTEPPGSNPVNSIYHYVDIAEEHGIIIHGITLGADADETSVRDAADTTGGEYHYVPDGDLVELFEVYRGIGRGTGSRLVR